MQRNTRRLSILLLCLGLTTAPTRAQDSEPEKPVLTEQQKREAAFAEKMSGCKMVGYFTLDGRPQGKEPRTEEYTIAKVEKLRGDNWRFKAKIAYGGRSVTLPIVVKVKWAGDTPVIQVTKIPVPTMGTYTARVLVYDTHYAGFWSGGSYGGHMYGRIQRADDDETKAVDEDAKKRPAIGGEQGKQDKQNKQAEQGKQVAPNKSGKEAATRKQTASDWPQFHGAFARGIADAFSYPTEWNVESGENLRWKTAIPGLAHSSPIVWGDRLYLTTAVRESGDSELTVGLYGSIAPVKDEGVHEFRVLCLDKDSGKILWSRASWKGTPKIARHPKGSHAASTPATDGRHVVAIFGSQGLFCYDSDGALLWKKSFGVLDAGYFKMKNAQWGYAASPVIHDGKVLVQCDIQDQSFLTALDVETGDEIWRTNRDEVPTWGSPTVHVGSDRSQVIVNGWKHMGGYELETGKELWKCAGGGDIPVPTPVVANDLIYLTSAHGRVAPILAISTKASGEFSIHADESEHVLWNWTRRGNYMQTPIVHGKLMFACHDTGRVSCIDAITGEKIWQQRIGGGRMGFTSSGILADGKLYFGSEDGEIHVLDAGREFKPLAINELGEDFMASPAASEGTLYFRTRRHLFAVAGGAD